MFLALTLNLGLVAVLSPINAQTTRRSTTATPRPTATPTLPSPDVPEIISRANDYIETERVGTAETPPTENNQPPVESESEKLTKRIKELNSRIQTLEGTQQNQYDQKQKRLLLNMDILSRAEQRAESLRKQLFELIDKESSIQTRLDQLSFDIRPEIIERSTAFAGSLRPEELRDTRRKTLESEKRNLENLLTQIQTSRISLEENVRKADLLVDKVRLKLEKEIDDALLDEPEQ